jgi:hypothetical protein
MLQFNYPPASSGLAQLAAQSNANAITLKADLQRTSDSLKSAAQQSALVTRQADPYATFQSNYARVVAARNSAIAYLDFDGSD